MTLWSIIFLLSFLSNLHFITLESNIVRGDTAKKATFKRVYIDVILNLIPLLSLSHIGLIKCCHKCLSCNKCLSINININRKECDLLAADRNNETTMDLFVSKQNWSYYDTIAKPVSNAYIYTHLPFSVCHYIMIMNVADFCGPIYKICM